MDIQSWCPVRLTGLISLLSKGLSRVFSKTTIHKHSAFFMVQFSHPYMTTGKNITLTRGTMVSKVMSLLFNMLSRLVIAFLPWSKLLLISWLQSPSPVILEPKIIKSVTFFIVSVSIYLSDTVPNRMKRDRTGKVLRNPFSLFPWLLWR